MENLAINNNVIVRGKTIPHISGGFGIDKRAMLAKHIAEMHKKELKHVNEAINSNRKRFIDGVDVIDVKGLDFAVDLVDREIFTINSINAAKNIYLLSERGYAKLIKIFDDEHSWSVYDQILDEYFDMRESGNIVPIKIPTELEILQATVNFMVEQDKKNLEQDKKIVKIGNKVERLEEEFNKEQVNEGFVSNDNIARRYKLFSTSNKPHFMFVDAIARELRIYNNTIGYKDEFINVRREKIYTGEVGVAVYYSVVAVGLIESYLNENFRLVGDFYKQKDRKGIYKKSTFVIGNVNYNFNETTFNKYKSH
ncbi:ORF6N domain-containing protein [Paenibacillus sophorae]|uniref:ORF6N domain-containing protein n=1 Tax=Paenibacillus sophorae TaxID=1333845 RepID=A0A1H8GRG7_9BACL|nr:ORF6N domain-containing protein [Paenibacillus sophorae]QWU14311.1 ORF6N domain-containing protein [Paenibacillus sophorae]SEN46409.1 ORF6N domain-containing protein [Paenibacillus sophorae]